TGGLDLSSGVLGDLNLGNVTSATFGDTTNTGAMNINYTTTFTRPVSFLSTSSTAMTVAGTLTSTHDGGTDFTLTNAGGGITLSASKNISTASHTGGIAISAAGTFTTGGTNVIAGASASGSVSLTADTLSLSSTSPT